MTLLDRRIKETKKWKQLIGKKLLLAYFEYGKKLTRSQAIKAKCYDCCCGYPGGAQDCEMELCPLYPFMPYKGKNRKN